MSTYHIWTIGCQMNEADSERLGGALEQLGCKPVRTVEEADIIVLNSCVVRQGAEDKVVGRITTLQPLKAANPNKTIALMGCMVGPKTDSLRRQYPYVDVFMPPQQFEPLLKLVETREGTCLDNAAPMIAARPSVATYVPIIHGCNKFCTFCIVPYRRGRERSRPVQEIVAEVSMLVKRGVKEVTLLGQNVDSYGNDLPEQPDLADLLEAVNRVDGLVRIRFLTSHPNDMSQKLIEAVARLDKVCRFINLPVQAGDDQVLANMRRGYTVEQYLALVRRIRATIPGVGIVTDVIVGFPGETDTQFQHTIDLLNEVRFDKVHAAQYSTRPGTIAERNMEDNVPQEEKKRRFRLVEETQERIISEINARLLGTTEDVLVESRKDGRWEGRTSTGKLVYVDDARDIEGHLVKVRIEKTSPWSLQGAVLSTVAV